jgi:hypothetical protein
MKLKFFLGIRFDIIIALLKKIKNQKSYFLP